MTAAQPQSSDTMSWYPMRVTYGREEAIKEALDNEHIENFIPMRNEVYLDEHEERHVRLTPAIRNLIFIHSFRQTLTEMKMFDKRFHPLRFIIDHTRVNDNSPVMTIPERQMESFMKVASIPNNRVTILNEYNEEFFSKPGQHVRIVHGEFNGVEGVVKRIKKRKQVVVELKGLIAATIDFIPISWLEFLPDVN